jgi:hypothetical protein
MFSTDYFEARDRFRHLAGERALSLPVSVRGARDALTIDIAWLGTSDAQRIVLATSGLHGVEGFAGSAVQCALLRDPPALAPGSALVLVHALNPWGFAQLRRVNENNVDLNRNFLPARTGYGGAPRLYPVLDPLLNPRSRPRRDGFLLRAAVHALRLGVRTCRQAIAEGQYEYPAGLFYGGRALEQGPARFLDWLRVTLPRAQRLLVLDLHTGLGRHGAQTLLAEPDMPAARVAYWARALDARIEGGAGATDPGGFSARGSLAGAIRQAAAQARPEFFTVDYGTCSGLKLLYALREENRWHHHGDRTLTHPAKARLKAAFAPASERWRAAVVRQGDALLRAAVRAFAAEEV